MNQEEILKKAAEASKQMQAPQPQIVPPSPVPMSIQIGQTRDGSGNALVVLAIMHPVGSSIFHLDPDGADKIADVIKETARLAKSGLEVPHLRGL